MSAAPVLYLGDTSLRGAAAYLGGVMAHAGISFDYVPSDQQTPAEVIAPAHPRKLVILSDYPAKNLGRAAQLALLDQVARGTGLLMIGGWESYCGLCGDWGASPLADALPVSISLQDDRVNCDQPTLVFCREEHAITAGLPWAERPPTIGGFNRIAAKPGAQTLLEAHRFTAGWRGDACELTPAGVEPLLVVGIHGQGRTVALATDVAPHWVGGLVDWGTGRVKARALSGGGGEEIEVGDLYARFFQQLLNWTGQL